MTHDGEAVHQRLRVGDAGRELLVSLLEVALEHHTHDAVRALGGGGAELRGNVRGHNRLVAEDLLRVAVGAILR